MTIFPIPIYHLPQIDLLSAAVVPLEPGEDEGRRRQVAQAYQEEIMTAKSLMEVGPEAAHPVWLAGPGSRYWGDGLLPRNLWPLQALDTVQEQAEVFQRTVERRKEISAVERNLQLLVIDIREAHADMLTKADSWAMSTRARYLEAAVRQLVGPDLDLSFLTVKQEEVRRGRSGSSSHWGGGR